MNEVKEAVYTVVRTSVSASVSDDLHDECDLHSELGLTSLDMVLIITSLCKSLQVNVLSDPAIPIGEVRRLGQLTELFVAELRKAGK